MGIAAAFRDETTKLASAPGAGPGPVQRWARRIGGAAAVAAPLAVGAYGLGRGLKRGERDKEQAAHADAMRAARLAGRPAPY